MNPIWGYRHTHGELPAPAATVAPSTVRQVLREAGIDPATERPTTTWITQAARTRRFDPASGHHL